MWAWRIECFVAPFDRRGGFGVGTGEGEGVAGEPAAFEAGVSETRSGRLIPVKSDWVPFGVEFFDLPTAPGQHVDVAGLLVNPDFGRPPRPAEVERSRRFVDERRRGRSSQRARPAMVSEVSDGSQSHGGEGAAESRPHQSCRRDELEGEISAETAAKEPAPSAGRLSRSREPRSRVSHSLSPHSCPYRLIPRRPTMLVSCHEPAGSNPFPVFCHHPWWPPVPGTTMSKHRGSQDRGDKNTFGLLCQEAVPEQPGPSSEPVIEFAGNRDNSDVLRRGHRSTFV